MGETRHGTNHPLSKQRQCTSQSPSFQWREKETKAESNPQPLSETPRSRIPPLEKNLDRDGFPLPPPSPPPRSIDKIMEDLCEVTIQYCNVQDPIEREVRRQRVFNGEARGLMEETAASILSASVATPTQNRVVALLD